jgi:hypothetical protein
MNKYPNTGALFYARNKVNPKSPDLSGDMSFTREMLKKALNETDEDDIVIKLSGWTKQGTNGDYFSMKVNDYKPAQQQAQQKPQANDEDIPF